MNFKKNLHLTKKATAILGAIATSSFLGLPVLAQQPMNPNSSTYPNTPGVGNQQFSGDCPPGMMRADQQSAGASSVYSAGGGTVVTPNQDQLRNQQALEGRAPDTSNPVMQQYPNNQGATQNEMRSSNGNYSSPAGSTRLNMDPQLTPRQGGNATFDASAPGIRNFPNQTDVRTVPPQAGTVSGSGGMYEGATSQGTGTIQSDRAVSADNSRFYSTEGSLMDSHNQQEDAAWYANATATGGATNGANGWLVRQANEPDMRKMQRLYEENNRTDLQQRQSTIQSGTYQSTQIPSATAGSTAQCVPIR